MFYDDRIDDFRFYGEGLSLKNATVLANETDQKVEGVDHSSACVKARIKSDSTISYTQTACTDDAQYVCIKTIKTCTAEVTALPDS